MYYLVCYGDSLIEGFPFGPSYSWTKVLESTGELKTYNYGVCGECTDDILERMQRYPLPEYVHHVLFLGGANDIIEGTPLKFTVGVIGKMLRWCQEKHYELCLVLPLSSSDAELQRRLLKLRDELEQRYGEQCFLLDLAPAMGTEPSAYLDGVHPTVATYQRMGDYARPLLLEWLQGTAQD